MFNILYKVIVDIEDKHDATRVMAVSVCVMKKNVNLCILSQ